MIEFKLSRWKGLFLAIWSGQALSVVGSHLVRFSLIWWITVKTGRASTLAIATLLGVLPQMLAPMAGALIDRWNRRHIMILADAFIALAVAFLAVIFWLGIARTWHVMVILLAGSVGDVFHNNAMVASTTLMVPKNQLSRIAGMNQTLTGISNVVAPPLGALLVSIMPIGQILAIDVATALIAIVPLIFILIPQPNVREGQKKSTTIVHTFVEGFRYLLNCKGLLFLFIYSSAIRLIARPAWQMLPLLITKHFGGEAIHLGMMSSAFGFGMIAGGIILGLWGGFRKRIMTSWAGLLGCGISFLILGVTPVGSFWIAVATSAFFGIVFSIYMGPIRAIIQATVPPHIQGRISTIYTSAMAMTAPIGLGIIGMFGDLLGINVIYVFGGASIMFFALTMRMTPSVMKIDDPDERKPI